MQARVGAAQLLDELVDIGEALVPCNRGESGDREVLLGAVDDDAGFALQKVFEKTELAWFKHPKAPSLRQ